MLEGVGGGKIFENRQAAWGFCLNHPYHLELGAGSLRKLFT